MDKAAIYNIVVHINKGFCNILKSKICQKKCRTYKIFRISLDRSRDMVVEVEVIGYPIVQYDQESNNKKYMYFPF